MSRLQVSLARDNLWFTLISLLHIYQMAFPRIRMVILVGFKPLVTHAPLLFGWYNETCTIQTIKLLGLDEENLF